MDCRDASDETNCSKYSGTLEVPGYSKLNATWKFLCPVHPLFFFFFQPVAAPILSFSVTMGIVYPEPLFVTMMMTVETVAMKSLAVCWFSL